MNLKIKFVYNWERMEYSINPQIYIEKWRKLLFSQQKWSLPYKLTKIPLAWVNPSSVSWSVTYTS